MTVLMPKGSFSLIIQGRMNSMTYFIYSQSNLSDFFLIFESTKSQINFNSPVTSTDGYRDKVPCQIHNLFYYWNRQRCFRHTDPYNQWRLPEEPDDCSRADIAKTYRLGDGF